VDSIVIAINPLRTLNVKLHTSLDLDLAHLELIVLLLEPDLQHITLAVLQQLLQLVLRDRLLLHLLLHLLHLLPRQELLPLEPEDLLGSRKNIILLKESI